MIAWWITFFYMAFMIVVHSKKAKAFKKDWKLYLRYLFVFISSGYALSYSPKWGTLYLMFSTYLVTGNLFEIRK